MNWRDRCNNCGYEAGRHPVLGLCETFEPHPSPKWAQDLADRIQDESPGFVAKVLTDVAEGYRGK